MKTNYTNATETIANRHGRTHLLMVVFGIMIAIICTLMLLLDVRSSQDHKGSSNMMETSKSALHQQITKATTTTVHSVISLLK